MASETLHQSSLIGKKSAPSTLEYVDVQEIRDGIIVLRDGSLRAVLTVSSINFELKSGDEQDAIIARYQQFLNSLDFPIQIVVSSRRINVAPYLETLKTREAAETNELMRMQIYEYRNFVKNLTEVQNIMTKSFFIAVPFFPVESNKKSVFSGLARMFHSDLVVRHKLEQFDAYKSQLFQRVDHITAGLSGIGLRMVMLNTEEAIEMLYNAYNPTLHGASIINNIESMEINDRGLR
jgi:type IV secretory pathway VirB4 component